MGDGYLYIVAGRTHGERLSYPHIVQSRADFVQHPGSRQGARKAVAGGFLRIEFGELQLHRPPRQASRKLAVAAHVLRPGQCLHPLHGGVVQRGRIRRQLHGDAGP